MGRACAFAQNLRIVAEKAALIADVEFVASWVEDGDQIMLVSDGGNSVCCAPGVNKIFQISSHDSSKASSG